MLSLSLEAVGLFTLAKTLVRRLSCQADDLSFDNLHRKFHALLLCFHTTILNQKTPIFHLVSLHRYEFFNAAYPGRVPSQSRVTADVMVKVLVAVSSLWAGLWSAISTHSPRDALRFGNETTKDEQIAGRDRFLTCCALDMNSSFASIGQVQDCSKTLLGLQAKLHIMRLAHIASMNLPETVSLSDSTQTSHRSLRDETQYLRRMLQRVHNLALCSLEVWNRTKLPALPSSSHDKPTPWTPLFSSKDSGKLDSSVPQELWRTTQ